MRIFRRVLLALFVTCTSLHALPSPAAEPRIKNGLATTDFPTTGALLEGASVEVATQQCSATLIGCETVLTAAHCVCAVDGGLCDPDESRFFVYLQNGGLFGVDSITPHPAYVDPVGDNDLAVIHLGAPVTGIPPSPLATDSPAFGTSATIVGFGLDDEPSAPDVSGVKRFGKLLTEDCEPLPLMDNDQHVCWTFEPPFGPAGEDSNTCPGDSGGPLFVAEGTHEALAGVTSFGVGLTSCSEGASASANVANLAAFVEATAGADLVNATCGTIGQMGGPGVDVHDFDGDLSALSFEGLHTFEVPAGTRDLRVTLNGTEGGSADFDLFVRAGSPPESGGGLADCSSQNSGQFESCTFADPQPGTWHALASRVAGAGSYQLTASVFADAVVCGDGLLDVGETCDDGNTVSGDGCSALCSVEFDSCPTWPQLDCEVASRKTKLNMQWGKDKLIWQWRDFSTLQSLGDPAGGDTSYRLCLYDEVAGVPAVALQAHIPPGPAWTAKRNGFRFKANSSEFDGIRKAQLKNTRRAKLKFMGTGMEFPTRIEQDDQVIVQLGNSEGSCWQGCYAAPPRRNDTRKFVDQESFACDIAPAPICGNGITEPGEDCDDGNTAVGDGCSTACEVEIPVCGNGVQDPEEGCDDGNTIDDDDCRNDCTLPVCGDGLLQGSEACDDGNTAAGDGCSEVCQLEPVCGDGLVQGSEACDDGNTIDDDDCRNDCTLPVCGDGLVQGSETCDDGNTIAGDGCEPDCTPTP